MENRMMNILKNTKTHHLTPDSILCRFCLASLIWIIIGGFCGEVWGNEAPITGSAFKTGSNKDNSTTQIWSGPHANFTLTGTDISHTDAAGTEHITFKGGNTYTITWNCPNSDCNISVTAISLTISNPGGKFKMKIDDTDVDDVPLWAIGTKRSKSYSPGLGNNGSITLYTSGNADIYTIKMTYSITPNAPTAVSPEVIREIYVTKPEEDPQVIDLSELFAMSDPAEDLEYSYTKSGGSLDGDNFYATTVGEYTVRAQIDADDCHTASALSDDAVTIKVKKWSPTLTLADLTAEQKKVDRTVLDIWPNYFDLSSLWAAEYVGGGLSYSIVSSAISENGHLVDADEDGVDDYFYATVAGDYTIRINSAEDDYYNDAYEDVTITVRPKAHPSYTMNNPSAATTLKVDGVIENAFTFKNVSWDSDFSWTIDSDIDEINNGDDMVIEYDSASNTIIAHNAGTATLQFVQAETNDYYGVSSEVYTFTVSKYTTTLSGSVTTAMDVDGTQTISLSATNTTTAYPLEGNSYDFYYTIDPDFGDNDETTGCAEGHESDVIGYDPIKKEITAYNAGSATLRIAQKETYKYQGASLTLDVEVSKLTPDNTWNASGAGYYYGAVIPNIFSGDEAGGVIMRSSDEVVATVNNATNTLTINAKVDGHTYTDITITQAANYKYNSQETVVRVTPATMPPGVPFVYDKDRFDNTLVTVTKSGTCSMDDVGSATEHILFNDGSHTGTHYVIIHFEGTPDKMTFSYKTKEDAGTREMYIQQSATNSFSDSGPVLWSKSGISKGSWTTETVQLDPTTRYLKIRFYNATAKTCGRFQINSISELQGYKYLKNGDKYLSRGADWATRAVMDEFGTLVRMTRETSDNTNYTTKLMFMDNQDYLFETDDYYIYTDKQSNTKYNYIQEESEGGVTFKNTDSNRYLKIDGSNLMPTETAGDATKWVLEDYTEHPARMEAHVNSIAAAAASNTTDFASLSTLSDLSSAIATQYLQVSEKASKTDYTEQTTSASRDGGYSTVYTNTVNDLAPGLYRLTVQAFCQPAKSTSVGWDNHTNGYESVLAYMFAGDKKIPIKSVYDEGQASTGSGNYEEHGGNYYPTNNTAAEAIFNASPNNYKNEMFIYLTEAGSLTYGLHNASYTGGNWVAFKNYKLERVERRSLEFDGNSGTDWSTAANWTGGIVPGQYDKVTISSDVEISGEEAVYSLSVGDSKKVTILPTGGLTVGVEGITGAGKDNITLKAGIGTVGSPKGQTGYLRVSPDWDGTMPNATVELFSKAYADNSNQTATWQYVGSPLEDKIYGWDICTYGNQFIYGWSEKDGDWFDCFDEKLSPFDGYSLTQNVSPNGGLFTFTGKLVEPEEQTVNLGFAGDAESGNKGYNVVANSFTAPIDISKMNTTTDFVNATATIYMFNTGSPTDVANNPTFADKTYSTAGQYIEVTPGTAKVMYQNDDTYPVLIPAMQGFCVKATATGAKLKLNYRNVVWDADYGTHPNKPLRVAAQKTEEQEANEPNVTDFIKVTLADGEAADILYLLASESYDKSYENGYDAPKMMSDDPALPNVFAVEDDGQFAIDATSDIEGTFIGVRTGAASNYTIYFSHVNAETEWMLLDIQTNKTTRIANEASYSFSAKANSLLTNRFVIVEWDGNAGTATGTEETTIQNKIQKFIYNDQLFILKDGVLYDARGMVVRR